MIRRHFLAGVVGLKAMCAATALMVGVGQAEAAVMPLPLGSYEILMTFENASVYCRYDCEDEQVHPFVGISVGETKRGTLNILPVWDFQNGGYYPDSIGLDLTWEGGTIFQPMYSLTRLEDDRNYFLNGLLDAFDFSFTNGLINGMFSTDRGVDGTGGRLEQINKFSFIEVAPVPLPMSVALMPLGLGAFAMMRKRRRLS